MAASWPKSLDTIYRRRRAGRQARGRDHRRQVPDPRLRRAARSCRALQVLDAVQAGTVEMGHTAIYYYFGKDPTFALGTSIPFGMNTRQNYAWWYFGGGAEAMAPLFKEYGCVAMPAGNTGCQMGGWFRKEIKTVADLKGLKFRIGGMAGLVLAKLGVVPQMIARPGHLPGAREGHHRRRRSGSAPTTTRSSASTRSPSTTTTRAGGKAAR